MSTEVLVDRARLEEVQPLAAAYRDDATISGARQSPLPAQGIYWIARDAQRSPMGYAAGRLSPDGLLLGPIYVLPQHRRAGVARRLLHAIDEWASGTRLALVEVAVAADNDAGVRFLESAGYRTRQLLMARGTRA